MNVDNDTAQPRERTAIWDALRYHPVPVVLGAVLGLLLGFGVAAALPSTTSANSTVLLRPLPGNPYSTDTDRDPLVALQTEAQLVRSDEVSQLVIDDLGLDTAVGDLRSRVRSSVPSNTQVIQVEYTGSGSEATRIAQAYADQYLLFRVTRGEAFRQTQLASLDRQIANRQEELAQIAALPAGPSRDDVSSSVSQALVSLQSQRDNLAEATLDPGQVIVPARQSGGGPGLLDVLLPLLGLLVGAGLGLLLAVMRERSVGLLRHVEDVEDADVPVLSVLPATPAKGGGPSHEQRLAVRGLVLALSAAPQARTVAVTPVTPAAHAHVLCEHAAESAAAHGRPAVTVDAQRLTVDPQAAPAEVAGTRAAMIALLSAARQGDHRRLSESASAVGLDPEGTVRAWPATAQGEEPELTLVATGDSARSGTDLVLECVDAVVLAVQLGQTRRDSLDRALTALRYLGVPVLGVVALEGGLPASPPARAEQDTEASTQVAAEASAAAPGRS